MIIRMISMAFLPAGICLALLGGCSPQEGARGGPVVAASIHPLGALAEQIAGGDASVLVLLPPGASPHSFEPTPRAVVEGSTASLVLRVGLGLDDWMRPLVRDALSHGAPEIVAGSLVDSLLPAIAGEDLLETGPRHEETYDPHIWLVPLDMIPFCRKTGQALASIDPVHADGYRSRAAACEDSLQALDRQLAAILAPARGVPFVAVHNAWSYLARRYGLKQVEVIQRVATREPGPRSMAEIADGAARAGAKAIFTEVQVSTASARTMASELGLRVALLDPQGTPDDPGRNRYFDLMRWNAHRIAEALAP